MERERPTRAKVRALLFLIAALVAVAACTKSEPGVARLEGERSLEQMADGLGSDVLRHVQRGIAPGVSGEISIVPMPNFYLGPQGALAKLGTDEPEVFTAHSSPWNYLVRVPLVMWGPRFVEPGTSDDPEVDLADLAPTYARWLKMNQMSGEGKPLEQGVVYERTPRLIFTIVVDGMGWNVLRQHPQSWPNLRAIMDEGRSFTSATIGSSPSLTAAIHANIGTGTYPHEHGVPGNPYFTPKDPSTLIAPTIGDLWDAQNDNRPAVGTVSVLPTHLTMVGHGSSYEGGDKDPAVYWDKNTDRWTTAEEHFTLPDYLEDQGFSRLESYERPLDSDDGILDGRWMGGDLDEVRSATPAFVRFQGDAVIRSIDEEQLGGDDVTDLFYVEFKSPDEAGHIWNMLSPQQPAVLQEVDRQIGRIKAALDERLGDGYVLTITADHGQQPMASAVEGWLIDQKELERDLESEFDGDVDLQSYQAFLPDDVDAEQVAAFLSAYTIGDNIPEGAEGAERVSDEQRALPVFAGAFPSDYLADLTEAEIDDAGDGEWPEGDYGARIRAIKR